MTKWQVTHVFANKIPVTTRIDEYPSLGIAMDYEGELLVGLRHVVTSADDLTEEEIVTRSVAELLLVRELISFRCGVKIAVRRSDAHRLPEASPQPQDPTAPTRVEVTINLVMRRATMQASGVVINPVALPNEALLGAVVKKYRRINTWLLMANRAKATSDDEDAIRIYAFIIEDLVTTDAAIASSFQEKDLRYTRHFVSHGTELKSTAVQSFLSQHGITPPYQFDPTDATHTGFLAKQRIQASSFVEDQLNKCFR